jgi:CBS domain-containing protein
MFDAGQRARARFPENQHMNIVDFCVPAIAVAYRGMAVSEAARLMHEHHVGSLIVVEERDSGKMPIGVLTDRDIVIAVVAKDLDARTIPVSEVMSTDVVAVREDDDIRDALGLMRRRGVRRAPVVTRGGALVGIVTLDDLLRMLVSQLDDLASAISTELSVEPILRT